MLIDHRRLALDFVVLAERERNGESLRIVDYPGPKYAIAAGVSVLLSIDDNLNRIANAMERLADQAGER